MLDFVRFYSIPKAAATWSPCAFSAERSAANRDDSPIDIAATPRIIKLRPTLLEIFSHRVLWILCCAEAGANADGVLRYDLSLL